MILHYTCTSAQSAGSLIVTSPIHRDIRSIVGYVYSKNGFGLALSSIFKSYLIIYYIYISDPIRQMPVEAFIRVCLLLIVSVGLTIRSRNAGQMLEENN